MKTPRQTTKEQNHPHKMPGHPNHEEWLIDESVEETFPASDPISPATEPDEKAQRKQPKK